jgi:2-hydroxychromene-2-carboxylate isomerase
MHTPAPDPRRKAARPRFYFSFRSPYSWLGYRDLMAGYPGIAPTLEWRPFWEPDELSARMLGEAGGTFPSVDQSRAKARYILQEVRRLARARGLAIVWPVDRDPCWEVPHLAYLAAARHGRAPEFIEHVYRARWEEGRDITDRGVVAAIAARLGLPAAELASAADDPGLREAGCEALLAIDADGVFGVPLFVHGHDKFWGVDRLPWFAAALRQSPEPPAGPGELAGVPGVPAADQGHAGGCG